MPLQPPNRCLPLYVCVCECVCVCVCVCARVCARASALVYMFLRRWRSPCASLLSDTSQLPPLQLLSCIDPLSRPPLSDQVLQEEEKLRKEREAREVGACGWDVECGGGRRLAACGEVVGFRQEMTVWAVPCHISRHAQLPMPPMLPSHAPTCPVLPPSPHSPPPRNSPGGLCC
jgi:hypothetical protein